jgi:Flp pilus assembly protein TadG
VFEFSWYFYNQQLVEAGVRDAARYMARVALTGGNTNPCTQADPGGTLYTTDAANIATTAQTASGGTARVSGWTGAQVTISCVASPSLSHGLYADGSSSMTIISVSTTVADPSLGLFSALGLTAPSLTFAHQERYLGPG